MKLLLLVFFLQCLGAYKQRFKHRAWTSANSNTNDFPTSYTNTHAYSFSSVMALYGENYFTGGASSSSTVAPTKPISSKKIIPSPYNDIVDVNPQRRALVFEVVLPKDLGFEILQGPGFPIVGKVSVEYSPVLFSSSSF